LEIIEEETLIGIEPSTGIAPSIINLESQSISDNMPQLPVGTTMYGYVLSGSIGPGPCYFDVEDPTTITKLSYVDFFASGGAWTCDGKWLVTDYYNGALYEIDPETGEIWEIGGGGTGMNGLTCDPTTCILYGASGNGATGGLWKIDSDTGEQEYIGDFVSTAWIIGMTCTQDGILYGWAINPDYLYTINKETGEATPVGPLGINLNYAQDGDYDPATETLYLAAFTLSPGYGSYLYTCNMETGECTLVGTLGDGYTEIDATMIQWTCCADHDVGVKDIISPFDGDAGEDMEVIVQVKNYGYLTEVYVPVNVVILKDGLYEEYNETEYTNIIEPGKTVDVEMPPWTPDDWQSEFNEYIDYKITACTLFDDNNPDNDYKEEWFELYFGYFHDVGCTNVIGPKGGPAQTFPVNATIKNFGQYDECCFKTYVEIAELDTDNQIELLTEDFSEPTFPPNGWTKTHENWKYSNSNYAGGSSGEARFYNSPPSTDKFRLYTPAIDTSDYSAIEIEFKHYVDHDTIPYILQVETSEDGVNWDVVWDINPTKDVGPETINISTAKNVGSTTYVSWTFNGNSSSIYYWFIDDIVINGYTSFDPEYEDYHCTTMIEPGKENELEFDDWTPDYLQYETTDTKIYLVKAWTDMDIPPDENPDNDLFVKSIILDYFHDVAIQVSSPIERGPDIIWDIGFTDGNNEYLWRQTSAEVYVPPSDQDIDGLASNIGTFPERDMTCYAEIYEFYSDCENGNLVYEDNITDIDILTPLTGTKTLTFDDYNFEVEGLYTLDLNLVDDNDDYTDNNTMELIIGCDATPPATTYALSPATPDGLNGWYISDVEITLTAADPTIGCDSDGSGVQEIKYQVDGGAVQTIPGDTGVFTVTTDSTMHNIKYWSIDNVGNAESQKTIQFKQDQTVPEIDFTYEWSGDKAPYTFTFNATATDATSGMQRVEFWFNYVLQETIVGSGPYYVWEILWVPLPHVIMRAIAYDFAGLNAFDDIVDPKLNKNSVTQSIGTCSQSTNIWLLKWLDRFPFLQRLLTFRGWFN
jgi:hypothetical protein